MPDDFRSVAASDIYLSNKCQIVADKNTRPDAQPGRKFFVVRITDANYVCEFRIRPFHLKQSKKPRPVWGDAETGFLNLHVFHANPLFHH